MRCVFRFPFDWRNPHGYLIAFSLSYVLHINVCKFLVYEVSSGAAIYMLVTSLIKDIKKNLIAFSVQVKLESNHVLLAKSFFDAIHFHSRVKR